MNVPQESATATDWNVLLVGAGVVGTAIAQAHLDRGVDVWLSDRCMTALDDSVATLVRSAHLAGRDLDTVECQLDGLQAAVRRISAADACRDSSPDSPSRQDCGIGQNPAPWIVIESVVEQIDVKRELFKQLMDVFAQRAIYCTNTSTLQIQDIAKGLSHQAEFCGMHFFMPVSQRPGVEVIPHTSTSQRVVDAVKRHAERLHKHPFLAPDSPGFLVNRLLSPYLNQALLMVTSGATPAQIELAARRFGMPIGPLELIDWIGAPTMFHAGRAFWQAFPKRLDPSPMLAGLVKRKRLGRQAGGGLYDYDQEGRSDSLSATAVELIERYRRAQHSFTQQQADLLLTLPMWIEAKLVLESHPGVEKHQIENAIVGGLGYKRPDGFFDYFTTWGETAITETIERWQDSFRSLIGDHDV